MAFVTDIKTFAALGSGVIGSGWVARALAHGLDVVAWDPAPGAEAQLRARIAKCWDALERKGLAARRLEGPAALRRHDRGVRARRRLHPGKRARDAEPQARPAREDQRRRAARRADRLVDIRPAAIASSMPVQPGPSAASSAIRSTRSTCCRWSRWSAARRPRQTRSRQRSRSTSRWACARCMCARRCRVSSPTGCSRPYGASRCTWSTTAWRQPARSTTRSVSAPVSAGPSWAVS